MKELHNEIFTKTGCIQKNLLKKFAAGQMEKDDLHTIQKHLIECDFCSEALEGLENQKIPASYFDSIDRDIDVLTSKHRGKTGFITRHLMLAASFALLFTLSFLAYQYIDTSLQKNAQHDLAISEQYEAEEAATLHAPAMEESREDEFTQENERGQTLSLSKSEQEAGSDRLLEAPAEPKADRKAPADQQKSQLRDEKLPQTSSVAVTGNATTEKKPEMQLEQSVSYMDLVAAEADDDAPGTANRQKGETNKSAPANKMADKESESPKSKKNETRSSASQSAAGAPAQAPSMAYEVKQAPKGYKLDAIHNYKVVDYRDEYASKQEEEKRKMQFANEHTPAKYPGKDDKKIAEAAENEEVVEITYRQTLEKGIQQYDAGQYNQALGQFQLILKAHPSDVNAQFYGGLCLYKLHRYTEAHKMLDQAMQNQISFFYAEAEWYKALSYIGQNDTKQARKTLKKIVNEGGFYKNKASEKLEQLGE